MPWCQSDISTIRPRFPVLRASLLVRDEIEATAGSMKGSLLDAAIGVRYVAEDLVSGIFDSNRAAKDDGWL